jgi:hypothetical protein
MFDMIEMACDESERNFYMAGKKHPRRAVTTFCHRRGKHFRERIEGHGKMLIRPAQVSTFINSPHRLNVEEYSSVWINVTEDGGHMRHYNNFRYSKYRMYKKEYFEANITDNDLSVRNFTLKLLEVLVGVTGSSA